MNATPPDTIRNAVAKWRANPMDSVQAIDTFAQVFECSHQIENRFLHLFVELGCVDTVLQYFHAQKRVADKINALAFLANISIPETTAAEMATHKQLLRTAIEVANNGPVPPMREHALEMLGRVALAARANLMESNLAIMQAGMKAATNGETDIIRENALRLLLIFAMSKENHIAKAGISTVIQIGIEAAVTGRTTTIRERGILVLSSLASTMENTLVMTANSTLIQTALYSIKKNETDGTVSGALLLLFHLSMHHANALTLMRNAALLKTLSEVMSKNKSPRAKELCLRVFLHFTDAEVDGSILVDRDSPVLHAIIHGADNGETKDIRYVSLKLLGRLAAQEPNQVPMASIPALVKVAIAAAGKGETDEIKENGLRLLGNLVMHPVNNVALGGKNPAVMQVAMEGARFSKSNEVKLHAFRLINNLALNSMNHFTMLRNSTLIQCMIQAARAGATIEIRDVAVKMLSSLTMNEANKPTMAANITLIEAAMEGVGKNVPDEHRNLWMALVARLSSYPIVNQISMAENPGFLDNLIDSIGNDKPDEMREIGLLLLDSLTGYGSNSETICNNTELMKATVDAAGQSKSNNMKQMALVLLTNLAAKDKNLVRMASNPALVQAAIHGVSQGAREAIKTTALTLLCQFARSNENRDAIVSTVGTVEAAVGAITTGIAALKELGLRLLLNLSIATANHAVLSSILSANPAVMQAAMDGVGEYAINQIRDAAFALLANLALHRPNQIAMAGNSAIVRAGIEAATNGATAQIKYHGLMLLLTLARRDEVAENFASRADILSAVIKYIDTQPEVSLTLLGALSAFPKAAFAMDSPKLLEKLALFRQNGNSVEKLYASIVTINCIGMYPIRFGQLTQYHGVFKSLVETIFHMLDETSPATYDHGVSEVRFFTSYLGPLRRVSIIHFPHVLRTNALRVIAKSLHASLLEDYPLGALCTLDILLQYALDTKIFGTALEENDKIMPIVYAIIADYDDMVPEWFQVIHAAQCLIAVDNGTLNHVKQDLITTAANTKSSSINDSTMNVRFSYSKEDEEIANEMIKYLESHQVPVWHDIIDGANSALECMVDGMQNANVVIVVVSRHYIMSPVCRVELEFAFNLRRICYVVVEPSQMHNINDSWMEKYMKGAVPHMMHGRKTFQQDMRGVLKFLST